MTNTEIVEKLKRASAELSGGNFAEADRIANEILDCFASEPALDPNHVRTSDSDEFTLNSVYKANAILILANTANRRGNYEIALVETNKALSLAEKCGLTETKLQAWNIIGNVYQNLESHERSLEYYHRALSGYQERQDFSAVAGITGNIGNVYKSRRSFVEALDKYNGALLIHESLGEKSGIARISGNIGTVHNELGNYKTAMEYFEKSLAMRKELQELAGISRVTANIGALYANPGFEGYDAAKAETALLEAMETAQQLGAKHNAYEAYALLAGLYEHQNRWEEAYTQFKKFHQVKEEVQTAEAMHQAEQLEAQIRELEHRKQFAIERTRAQVTSDILANILPQTILDRLINGENKIADTHENVSVLFADIVGFTKLSADVPAGDLIDLLDQVFSRFDAICKDHGLEKIKTIGDAYMAVCGAPVQCDNPCERTTRVAIEMLDTFANQRFPSFAANLTFRIGLHSGTVVAGIIGQNKYSYDLWGDAVNTASRMESHGEGGRIHVSRDFLSKLADEMKVAGPIERVAQTQSVVSSDADSTTIAIPLGDNLDLVVIERGEMDIKGKGKMETFFLERLPGRL